jgi:DNA-binding NarL/FixJ family response regulator
MEGLRSLLESDEGLRVIAAENSLVDAMNSIRDTRPYLVVLDKALGVHAVVDCLFALRRSDSPPAAVVWGVSVSESEALRFLHAGARGVVRKTSSVKTVLQAMHTAAAGGTWMEDDMLREANRQSRTARSPLTSREAEVLELVQKGMRNKDIAFRLGIRVGTVKIHMKHIFEKTGVHGRHGLVVSGLKEKGLLPAIAS